MYKLENKAKTKLFWEVYAKKIYVLNIYVLNIFHRKYATLYIQ
jgi:hypothetical protein